MSKRKTERGMRELLRVDLRKKYGDTLLSPWRGRYLSAQHRFVDSDNGSLILSIKGETVIQSRDGGESWEPYSGPRAWPPHDKGMFQIKDSLLAIQGGDNRVALLMEDIFQGFT